MLVEVSFSRERAADLLAGEVDLVFARDAAASGVMQSILDDFSPLREGARALIDESGVEIARGDYEDKASILSALEDVYGVFAVQTPYESGGVEAEIRQGIALIDAAHRSEISHFIYSSVGSADQNTGIPHFDSKWKIEEHLRGTGMSYTIVRPVFFMENWLRMKEQIVQGQLSLPLTPETILQQVAVDDIGAFVAMAFEHPGKWHGTATDLAGDELFVDQIAQTLQANYSQISWEDFKKQAGHETTVMFRWFQDVGYHADVTALRQEFPNLVNFTQWRNTYWPTEAYAESLLWNKVFRLSIMPLASSVLRLPARHVLWPESTASAEKYGHTCVTRASNFPRAWRAVRRFANHH